MNRLIFIVIAGLLSLSSLAQKSAGMRGQRPTNVNGQGKIVGQVFDKQTNEAVEYANIVIYRMRDGRMETGTITDAEGKFEISNAPYGLFKVTIDFIGYDKITIDTVKLLPKKPFVSLGKQYLSQSAVMLEGIEVVADKIAYEYKIDKKVVNVSQDATAAGGTAIDVLENTPSVEVDIEGNVTMRGSSSFTVLINGRPSILDASDALQQIPTSSIENIEIITNPSAKYDPDGTAGIINVILKKQMEGGLSGILNLSAGMNDKYRTNLLLNYKVNKWNFIGGFDFRDDNFEMTRKSERETYNPETDISEFINSDGGRDMNRKSLSGRFGVEFNPSDKTFLSLSGRLGKYEFGLGGLSKNYEYTDPISSKLYYKNISDMSRSSDYYSVSFNFNHKFDDEGQNLDFSFTYSDSEGDDDDFSFDEETDALWNETGILLSSDRSIETEDEKEYRIKLDYVKPLSEKGSLEFGLQSRIDDSFEEYIYEEMIDDEWVFIPEISNSSDFKRAIHSAYAIWNNEKNGFGYQLGLRAEYTDREIEVEDLDAYVIDRIDLFPSVHLSKQLNDKNQLMLSYTRRIRRPRGRDLDPFITILDDNNRRQGNPELEPEYTDSYEFGWQKRFKTGFFNIEAYYRETTNLISRVLSNTDEGYVMHTSANIDKDYSFGLEAMINHEFSKKLTANLSGTFYNYKIEGSLDSETVDQESNNWRASLNTIYKFTPMSRLQLRLGYRGATATAQGERKGFLTSDLAIRHDFWKRKATFIVQVRDLFKTMKRDMIVEGTNYWEHLEMQRESQIVQVSLALKINNYKPKKNGRDSEDMDMSDDMEF